MERAILGIEGNCGYSLLGENIQDGEVEFVQIEQHNDELLSKAQCRAARAAHFQLERRLGRTIQFTFDPSHPYGG